MLNNRMLTAKQHLLGIIVLCLTAAAASAPWAHAEEPVITAVTPLKETVAQYETFEVRIALKAEYDNPFDTSQIHITGQFQDSDGTLYVVGGFMYQDFQRELDGELERLTPEGPAEWRIRFTPPKPGEYAYIILVTTARGRTFSARRKFVCEASEDDGFVRTFCGKYFQYDSGRPFFCLGQNLAWAKGPGTYDYDAWLEKLAESGANFARIWLWRNPTLDLELMPDDKGNGGVGKYDLANAWRLDHVLERCDKLGIKVMLCLFDFHPLTEDFWWAGEVYHPWENSVYNTINGGPLDSPAEFFSDKRAIALTRQLTRYVINRYGHSKAIACWELFNEIDLAPGFRWSLGDIEDWHEQMSALVSTLDPYSRPVTTSLARSHGQSRLWANPLISLVQSHSYNEKDMGDRVPFFVRSFDPTGKPHLIGEIGNHVDLTEDDEEDDPTALHLHNAIWAAMTSGSAGGPLTWWWDSYIHPRNLYSIYTVPSKFARTIQWCEQEMEPTGVKVQMAVDDIKTDAKLKAHVHGAVHKRKLGDGPTFEVDYAHDGAFSVHVDRVASGGDLKIYLDAKLALREELPATKARGSWKELEWNKEYAYWEAIYDRTFTISVPEGKHVIAVNNDGRDWLTISHVELLNYAERGKVVRIETDDTWGPMEFDQYKIEPDGKLVGFPGISLRALALAGKTTTIAWVQHENNTWYDRKGGEPAPDPARGLLVFPAIGPGNYKVQQWNTYTGEIEDKGIVKVPDDSTLQFTTALIDTDTAYRIEKAPDDPEPPAEPDADEKEADAPAPGDDAPEDDAGRDDARN